MSYEENLVKMEIQRAISSDAYFDARPAEWNVQTSKIFNDGFERGWNNQTVKIPEVKN